MTAHFPTDPSWWWSLVDAYNRELLRGQPAGREYLADERPDDDDCPVSADDEDLEEADAEALADMGRLFHPSPASMADPASTDARHELLRLALRSGLLTPEQASAAGWRGGAAVGT